MAFIRTKNYDRDRLYKHAGLVAEIIAGVLAFIISFRFTPAYYSYAMVIFCLYFIYDSIKSKEIRFPMPSRLFIWGYCLLYGSLLLSGIINGDKDGLNWTRQYIYWSLPMWMIGYLGGKYFINKGFFIGILSASIITSLWGIVQKVHYPTERIYSFYNYPTQYGVVIAIVFPVLLYCFFKSQKMHMRIISGIACALLSLCLIWTDTRAAVLSLCTGIIASTLIILLQKHSIMDFRQKAAAVMVVFVVAAVGIIVFGYMQNHRNTDMARLGGERIFMLSSSYEMWKDHKLSGIGVNSWETYYYSDRYHPEGAQEQHLTMPHNMFIYFLSTAGIIGGLGFIGYTMFTLIGLLKLPYENNWLAEWCILAIFIAFFINGMFDSTFINKVAVKIYYAMMGLFMMWDVNSHRLKGELKNDK